MEGKAILLVRVSTQKQDFDEQEKQLYNLAVADGFAEHSIIPICEKESGIKLKEDERKGLNRLKEEVAKGGISCVYAWEVSRIGRKKKVIFSITEYLAERGIQLIVKEPYIKLLNEDGTINDGAETVLTLFAQISESEMRNKQSRWARTRKANALKGKWNGGKNVKFGYSLDENNFYVINEEEANIIRTVYDLYVNNNFGQNLLRKELASRGIIIGMDRCQKILSDIGYTGETYKTTVWTNSNGTPKRTTGYDITYPAIISKEVFEKAQQKRLNNNKSCVRGENFYFAKGILKCPICGHSFIAYKVQKVYMCVAHKHDNHDIEKCPNTTTININLLDTILWANTWIQYTNYLLSELDTERENMAAEKEILNTKINAANAEIEKVQSKIERIAELYADGIYNKERYQLEVAKVRDKVNELKQSIIAYNQRINNINAILSTEENSDTELDNWAKIVNDTANLDNLQKMSELVHRFITAVGIEEVNIDGKRAKKITITQIDGIVKTYYGYCRADKYQYWTNNGIKYVDFPVSQIIKRKVGRNVKY